MKQTLNSVLWLFALSAGSVACQESPPAPEPDTGETFLEARFDETFVRDTSAIVKIQTFRDGSPDSNQRVNRNIDEILQLLEARVAEINASLETAKIVPFEWKGPAEGGKEGRVVGYRLGTGKRKFSILTHLDTVPPGGDWPAFDPKVEQRAYRGEAPQDFLTGRGSIDDKGPAIIGLMVLEAAAKRFDGTQVLEDWTLEAASDTAEETSAAIPFYMKAEGQPELGIVYDAFWCVRAEKGIERPTFSLPVGKATGLGLWISEFASEEGPANQIPGTATATIRGEGIEAFAGKVKALYESYGFDDPDYRRAPLTIETKDGTVTLTTHVEGAQHGSAPDANRAEGANPLVSLANFLAGLAKDGTVDATNGYAQMATFMTWGWGTKVFGEYHPETLERHDDIFQEGNGTTWALTRVKTDQDMITLSMDVRYAQGHQSKQWDGKTDGLLGGVSLFPELLPIFVKQFREEHPGVDLQFKTSNAYAPDIRNPDGAPFRKMDAAFQAVLGKDCPRHAIGGGTDAKGNDHLIAAGALFNTAFGNPINYHGINEAAPLKDLKLSARVLYRVLVDTVAAPSENSE